MVYTANLHGWANCPEEFDDMRLAEPDRERRGPVALPALRRPRGALNAMNESLLRDRAHERMAVTLSKRLLDMADESGLEPILRAEIEAILSCMTEGEGREGLRALVEKRPPTYRGGGVP